jgi:6-phosphogluconolactonase
MRIEQYPDRDMLMFAVANAIASDLRLALQQNARASLAVPGGTTPGPVFDILAGLPLDWGRVTVMPSDERWVCEDSERSNARLIRKRLMRGHAVEATFVPLYADAPTPEQAMDRVAAAVSPHLPLSVALLGMGSDLHTASLFPGGDRLTDALAADAPAVLPMRAGGAEEPRVTLSARVLHDAMAIHVLFTGTDKRRALDLIEGRSPEEAPVKAVLANATVHWAE